MLERLRRWLFPPLSEEADDLLYLLHQNIWKLGPDCFGKADQVLVYDDLKVWPLNLCLPGDLFTEYAVKVNDSFCRFTDHEHTVLYKSAKSVLGRLTAAKLAEARRAGELQQKLTADAVRLRIRQVALEVSRP